MRRREGERRECFPKLQKHRDLVVAQPLNTCKVFNGIERVHVGVQLEMVVDEPNELPPIEELTLGEALLVQTGDLDGQDLTVCLDRWQQCHHQLAVKSDIASASSLPTRHASSRRSSPH